MDRSTFVVGSFTGPIRQYSSFNPYFSRFGSMKPLKKCEFSRSYTYLAEDKKNEYTKYVLKYISRDIVSKDAFRYEVEVIRNANHPNVITLLDAAIFPTHHLMVTDYFPLGNLKDNIGHFDLKTGEIYFFQISSGLKYLHGRNIIHRDINTENILIVSDRKCVITGFKVAVRLSTGMQTIGHTLGTPGFMAPELQKNPDGSYDGFKLDTYALGVTLFCFWVLRMHAPKHSDLDILINEIAFFYNIVLPRETEKLEFYKKVLKHLLDPSPESRWSIETLVTEMEAISWLDDARRITEKETSY